MAKRHKVEIKSGENGKVQGTQVLIDGEPIKRVCGLKIEIPLNGFFTVTIQHHVTKDDGKLLFAEGGVAIASKTLVFQGEITLEGELLE